MSGSSTAHAPGMQTVHLHQQAIALHHPPVMASRDRLLVCTSLVLDEEIPSISLARARCPCPPPAPARPARRSSVCRPDSMWQEPVRHENQCGHAQLGAGLPKEKSKRADMAGLSSAEGPQNYVGVFGCTGRRGLRCSRGHNRGKFDPRPRSPGSLHPGRAARQ